jgi:hypothetical protein
MQCDSQATVAAVPRQPLFSIPIFPQTTIFINRFTLIPFRVCQFKSSIKAFSPNNSVFKYASCKFPVRVFLATFRLPTAEELRLYSILPNFEAFTTPKQCSLCKTDKLLIEYYRVPRRKHEFADICKSCHLKIKKSKVPKPVKMENWDRSAKTKFVRYMQANPFYFRDTFKKDATIQNILNEYSLLMEKR